MKYPVLCISLFLASACGPSQGTKKVKRPVAPIGPLTAIDAFSMLPGDSDMVVGADFSKLRASKFWQQYGEKIQSELELGDAYDAFVATCKYDPMQTAEYGWIGVAGEQTNIIIFRGAMKNAIVGCAKQNPTISYKLGIITTKAGLAVGFRGDDTTVFSIRGAKQLRAALRGKDGLNTNGRFNAIYERLAGSSTWFALLDGPESMKKGRFKLGAAFGTVDFVSGLVNVRSGFALQSGYYARQFTYRVKSTVRKMKRQLPKTIKAVPDRLKIKQDREVVILSLSVSLGDIGELVGAMSSGQLIL